MRILQNIHLYPGHVNVIDALAPQNASHAQRVRIMVEEGLNGCHTLQPTADGSANAFLTSTADVGMQRAWAVANAMKADTHPHEVLLAQIEAFKPDVFYTHGSSYFPERVRTALKSHVRAAITWKAPPDFSDSMQGFDLAVNNFPSSFDRYRSLGINVGWFSPGFDDAMAPECLSTERPIDIVFVGGYSRHHSQRADMLEKVAQLSSRYHVRLALALDKASRLASSPLGLLPPLSRYRPSASLRKASIGPLYGREMYRLFSQAKIVINTAIDVAGADRGNIRCFEAMGCGALLLSDAGIYPEHMIDGETMVTYASLDDIVPKVEALLADEARRAQIAAQGQALLLGHYGKAENWARFQRLVAPLL